MSERSLMRNDTTPVVRRIPTNKADVFAFAIEGHMNDADLENLYGLLDGAYEQHDEIDLLVRLTGYEGVDWSAAFSKTTLLMRTQSLHHLRRYAIIGGPIWIQASVSLMQPFSSIQIKTFDADEESSAWTWLDAKPEPE